MLFHIGINLDSSTEGSAKNHDFLTFIKILKNIERMYVSCKSELCHFPDLPMLIKSKLSGYRAKLKQVLQERILNLLFLRHANVQECIISKIISDVKKNHLKTKSNNTEEPEDFFEFISRTEFPLSDHIKLIILKTLSRKDRKENIKKIKKILKRYQEAKDSLNPDNVDLVLTNKLQMFFNNFTEEQMIQMQATDPSR